MPQQLDGRYEILKPLGSGGFGKTYLARDLRIPGQPYCVVKQLHCISRKPEDKALAQELFQREAESLAILGHHDQIPRLLAYFTENDEFYLVEDFVDGRSLDDEIQAGQPWPEAAVFNLVQNILEVLAFVHRQGVIHRDIKPGNLIRRQRDGKIVLIDFGAIKQISQAQRQAHRTGTQIGTVGYMPPEQAQGKPRPNSDIYGVGMVAISALTGHPATGLPDDPQTGEVVWQHLAQVSPAFAQILSRMVRYYFQHRYQTIEEVQQSLKALLSTSPVPASHTTPRFSAAATQVASPVALPVSPSSPHRSPRTQRNPWLLGIGLAIFIPMLGGLAALLFNARTSLTRPTELSDSEADKPCTAEVVGNIRSERTAYRGSGNILQTGQGRSFELGTKETRGGWIQIQLPSGQMAWTHLDVVANESALKSCLRNQNIALDLISDIPPPPRPQPRPVTPTPVPPVTQPSSESSASDELLPAESLVTESEEAVDSTDLQESSDSNEEETLPSLPVTETDASDAIEESQPPEETAPPASSSTEATSESDSENEAIDSSESQDSP